MFTLGCDPEFFLRDRKGNFVPAFDTLGGTKLAPRVLECGHTVQEDGCALEIGIRPATTADEFAKFVGEAMAEVAELLKPLKLQVAIVPEATFTEQQLMNPKGWEVGCDPDYDAYTGEQRIMKDYTDLTRYAGGHIHIGAPSLLDPRTAGRYIKSLDVTVGYLLALKDKQHSRANVYGGPGKFRYKPYGVEYRTPSNGWLRYAAHQRSIFGMCESVLMQLEQGRTRLASYADDGHNYIVDAMLTGRSNEFCKSVAHGWSL